MKRTSLLKGLVVILLSAVLVANLTSLVFADDNTFDSWDSPANTTTNTATDNTMTNSATDTSNTNTNDWSGAIETNTSTNTDTYTNTNTGSATTTLNTDDTNENNSVNSLAYTGIEDTSILAVFAVLGVIVAAYSFKKIKEYNV